MNIRDALGAEFERRWNRNGRYSLRAFARDLGTHHTTVTRILDRRRRVMPRTIRLIGAHLGLTDSQISAACIEANADWVARFIGDSRFAANSRRLAVLSGVAVDDVNIALHHLLYHRRLAMTSPQRWQLETNECPTPSYAGR